MTLALVLRANRACSVLDHEQSVARSQVCRFHAARRATDLVDDQDRLRAVSDRVLDPLRIHIERKGIDINKYRPGPGVDNGIGSSDEGQAGTQHLVSRTNPCSHERQVKGGST